MTMQFKARVLLELGAELISSDAVALYELIKNGIDAGSKSIKLDIKVVLQPSAKRMIEEEFDPDEVETFSQVDFISRVEELLDPAAPQASRDEFLVRLGKPRSAEAALRALEEASFDCNSIVVADTGHGMSKQDLQDCYLTVGTPMRLHERRAAVAAPRKKGARIPLGEKGIGRLAAMRIGHYIDVLSGVSGELQYNKLTLDWRPVFDDPDLDSTALDFRPKKAGTKRNRSHGTSLTIRDLQSDWNAEKLSALSQTELAKLVDPFADNLGSQFLEIKYQQEDFLIEGFPSHLLRHADADCAIDYRVADERGKPTRPRLTVTTNYSHFKRAETLVHEGAHLKEIVSHPVKGRTQKFKPSDRLPDSDEVVAALRSLGPFSAHFYWFNRGRIKSTDSTLWAETLEVFTRRWSGGLLVYRDGFRVYPYGSASDDWLDLDRKALAASAYKLNRAQIIGYLRISSADNPVLQDQTNREGFRDNPEKEAMRRLLRQAIISDCRTFLERVDKENKALDDAAFGEIDSRISGNQRVALDSLRGLRTRVPDESDTINAVMEQLTEVQDAWERAKQALKAHDSEIERYIHLAGVGLMVELIAHELARATDDALGVLNSKSTATNPKNLEVLRAQLLTVNRRVRVLDQLSIPGRQRKFIHSVPELVETMADFYNAKAARHRVHLVVEKLGRGTFKKKVEKGQVLQILDNLLSNSIYWLDRRLDRTLQPKITITVDLDNDRVLVEDNGPGIPEGTGERVFDAFYTTKSEDGRGLGLFIARRLANDNDATMDLLPPKDGIHSGFELKFKGT